MRKFLFFSLAILILPGLTQSLQATTYYMSPTGLDGNPGTANQPWATFGRAWQSVVPGDTLILQDGIYYSNIDPTRGGQAGSPITIKAANDGKAIIDGEKVRVPIILWNYRNASFFVIEGIVAQNGPPAGTNSLPQTVISIETDDNIFRRVSAYNADPDENSAVIVVNYTAERNLLEDCVAAGTGRKMINLYHSHDNILRRCFSYALGWDGRQSCQDWPHVENTQIYNGSSHTIENCIAAGPMAGAGLSILANTSGAQAIGNKILGSVAINVSVNPDGTVVEYPQTRPQPTKCPITQVINFNYWQGTRVGMQFYADGAGEMRDNLIRDLLVWGNSGLGLTVNVGSLFSNNRLERVTITGDGLGLVNDGGPGTDAIRDQLQRLTVTDSVISVIRDSSGTTTYPPVTGGGARLQYRYINGVLMDGTNGQPAQALWPWPMEDRIRNEMGISVTNMIAKIAPSQVSGIGPVTQPRIEVGKIYTTLSSTVTTKAVTLTNKSATRLTVAAFVFEKGGNSPYTITGGTCPSAPFALDPSQSCNVQVAVKAGISGTAEDYLSFYSPEAVKYPFSARTFLSNAGSVVSSSGTPPPPPPPSSPATPQNLHIQSVQ